MHIEVRIQQPQQTKDALQFLLNGFRQCAGYRIFPRRQRAQFVEDLVRPVVSKNFGSQYCLQCLGVGLDLRMKAAELVERTDNTEAQCGVAFKEIFH